MLTVREAAERLQTHPASVNRYIKNGLLKAEKFGKAWVISESELEKFRKPVKVHKGGRPRKEGRAIGAAPPERQ